MSLVVCLALASSVRPSHGSATVNMLLLLRLSVITYVAAVWAGPAETVLGVAGRRVALPCRVATAKPGDVHVCWGRGQPAVFSCHNMLLNAAGARVTYKTSYRYSLSSTPSGPPALSIYNVRSSDSGLYHCRVQLPGLFNDKTFSVFLIVLKGNLNAPPTTQGGTLEAGTGSDVTQILWDSTVDDTTGPAVARVQAPVRRHDGNNLPMFLGNTLRMAFIVFIPAVILTAAYRMRRSIRKVTIDDDSQSEAAEDDVAL
ncbi:hepatitis A virus cellular receptor 1 homolog [Syngnathus typhle]|uniref:hepatitis A virus cellular receptor 1 homolog n=1 Tax=Syngnathus typhle TaxID=161592 RepID=UPI002A6B22A8|nr:hepatitis A virus cellular receptor 1 homolog [Syngnathus typhle]